MSDVKAKLSGMKQELDLRFMHIYQKLEEIRERSVT